MFIAALFMAASNWKEFRCPNMGLVKHTMTQRMMKYQMGYQNQQGVANADTWNA